VSDVLLSVRDLTVSFHTEEGRLVAVDGVSFDVPRKTTVAIVGESGCGKSVTAHAIMRILPSPPATIDSGRVELDGVDLLALPERKMREMRGAKVSIVFQEPMTALNPVYSVGSQIIEAFRIHQRIGRKDARARAIALLEQIGFPDPAERFDDYPHELSGGMRQRVMIAMALACKPLLMIADEPTSALDMLAAAQINALLADLQRQHDMSLLLISHDIGEVAENADAIVVLYAGQVVERGAARDVLGDPKHPYTRGLLASIPPLRKRRRRRRKTPTRLPAMEGNVPDLRNPPPYCRFSSRCPDAFVRCGTEAPELIQVGDVAVRCFLYDEAEEDAS
jgi:oligopeptide/dipeptide ABC transporter ATP-binding protein